MKTDLRRCAPAPSPRASPHWAAQWAASHAAGGCGRGQSSPQRYGEHAAAARPHAGPRALTLRSREGQSSTERGAHRDPRATADFWPHRASPGCCLLTPFTLPQSTTHTASSLAKSQLGHVPPPTSPGLLAALTETWDDPHHRACLPHPAEQPCHGEVAPSPLCACPLPQVCRNQGTHESIL